MNPSAMRRGSALALVAILAGCANLDTVVFVTKTSIGLDVDSHPPSASIAYDRVEGYIAPRYDNGAVPPVVGSVMTNGRIVDRTVRQFYATGAAAEKLSGITGVAPGERELRGGKKVMFFGTSTTLGIKVAFNPQGLDGFTFGYKRKELSIIPVGSRELPEGSGKMVDTYPSVFGMLDSDFVTSVSIDGTNFGLAQFFATGSAAEKLAEDPDMIARFRVYARDAVSVYTEAERRQRRSALNILYCLAKLDDQQLKPVWENAAKLQLFGDPAVATQLLTDAPKDARVRYTGEISLPSGTSEEYTGRIAGHEVFVCELAKK